MKPTKEQTKIINEIATHLISMALEDISPLIVFAAAMQCAAAIAHGVSANEEQFLKDARMIYRKVKEARQKQIEECDA